MLVWGLLLGLVPSSDWGHLGTCYSASPFRKILVADFPHFTHDLSRGLRLCFLFVSLFTLSSDRRLCLYVNYQAYTNIFTEAHHAEYNKNSEISFFRTGSWTVKSVPSSNSTLHSRHPFFWMVTASWSVPVLRIPRFVRRKLRNRIIFDIANLRQLFIVNCYDRKILGQRLFTITNFIMESHTRSSTAHRAINYLRTLILPGCLPQPAHLLLSDQSANPVEDTARRRN